MENGESGISEPIRAKDGMRRIGCGACFCSGVVWVGEDTQKCRYCQGKGFVLQKVQFVPSEQD